MSSRDRILDAYESLLIEGGERAATLNAVVERAGLSKGGLLYHFGTRQLSFLKSPQLLAVVQWDEGPRVSTELVNVDPSEIHIGMRVKPVFFDYPDDDVTLLRYEPAD